MSSFTPKDIVRLFELLNHEMRLESLEGEVYLVGGAVMCLVFNAWPATKGVDAYFQPAQKIRAAAAQVGVKAGIKEDWLNDVVKGYFSSKGEYDTFLELTHLHVFAARAEYLLAMKCLAMRIGEEFHDLDDIRYLIRHLNLKTYQEARDVMMRFYPLERFPQKTLYALEEIFEGSGSFPTPHPERSPEATPRGEVEGSLAKDPSIRPSGSLPGPSRFPAGRSGGAGRVSPDIKNSPRAQIFEPQKGQQ